MPSAMPTRVAVPDDCHRTDDPDGSMVLSDLSKLSYLMAGDRQRTVTSTGPTTGQLGDLPTVGRNLPFIQILKKAISPVS
jgi:hypothetical protein